MARVLLLHHSLNSCGGGERTCLYALEALIEAGHEVVLGTVEKTDWGRVERLTGRSWPRPHREVCLLRRLPLFGLYQRPLTSLHVARLMGGYDVVVNMHGDVMALPVDMTYLHFPITTATSKAFTKYFESVFWRMYFTPYYALNTHLSRRFYTRTLILTNSRFTRMVIRRVLGVDALVVYPPVDVHHYRHLSSHERAGNEVVSIGRMSPEKNWLMLPLIAREVRSAEFHLITSIYSPASVGLLTHLMRLKQRYGVENLHVYVNLSDWEKAQLLARAKAVLHLHPYEHFGIAVVEGMSAGCIPIVPKHGGQWYDICEGGAYGVGFDEFTVPSIATAVEKALDKWSLKEARRHSDAALRFEPQRFKRRMTLIVDRVSRAG